jgi:hypothetical protein
MPNMSPEAFEEVIALYGRLYDHIQKIGAARVGEKAINIVFGESHLNRNSLLAGEMIRDIAQQAPLNIKTAMMEMGPIGLETLSRATDATGMSEALQREYFNTKTVVTDSLHGKKSGPVGILSNKNFTIPRLRQTGTTIVPLEPDLSSFAEKTMRHRNSDMAVIAQQHGSGVVTVGAAHLADVADHLEPNATVIRILGSPEKVGTDLANHATTMGNDIREGLQKAYDSSFHASLGFDIGATGMAPHEVMEVAQQAATAFKKQRGLIEAIHSPSVPIPPVQMQQNMGEVIRNEILINMLVRQQNKTVAEAADILSNLPPENMRKVEASLFSHYPVLKDVMDGKSVIKEPIRQAPVPIVDKKGVVFSGPITIEREKGQKL